MATTEACRRIGKSRNLSKKNFFFNLLIENTQKRND